MKVRVYWYAGKDSHIRNAKGRPHDEVCEQIKEFCKQNGYVVKSSIVEARTRDQAIDTVWYQHRWQRDFSNEYFCEKVKETN